MGQKGRGRIPGFFGDKKENRLLKVWAGEEPILIILRGRYQFRPHSHHYERERNLAWIRWNRAFGFVWRPWKLLQSAKSFV